MHHVLIFCQGFDTHPNIPGRLNGLLSHANAALNAFVEEMKAMNLWNNVTLIQMSEFGRTLTPNGNDGTDHGWGGNYMMMGEVNNAIEFKGQFSESLII